VRAVRARGTFMQEAVPAGEGAMAVILGLEPQQVADCCKEAASLEPGKVVEPANFNSPEQTVIAGHAQAVDRAIAVCKAKGAKRAMPLPVSAPFHCQLMAPVKPRLREVLAGIAFARPIAPVIANASGQPNEDPARIVDLLVEQVTSPVRWVETVQGMAALGVDTLVEPRARQGAGRPGAAHRQGAADVLGRGSSRRRRRAQEGRRMIGARSRWMAALAASAALVALWGACAARGPLRKTVGDPAAARARTAATASSAGCRWPASPGPRSSTAGRSPCRSATAAAATKRPPERADGGPLKRCQYAMYAECTEEQGSPQCLSGQKCREGHCTVQCAIDAECGEGGLCRIGVCTRKRTSLTQCYDNRDCRWPESCFHGQCVTRTDAFRCNTDLDCGFGYRCLNGAANSRARPSVHGWRS